MFARGVNTLQITAVIIGKGHDEQADNKINSGLIQSSWPLPPTHTHTARPLNTDCLLNRLIGSRMSWVHSSTKNSDHHTLYSYPSESGLVSFQLQCNCIISHPFSSTTSFAPDSFADDARGDMDGGGAPVGGQSAQHSPWYRLNRVITRLCSTHQFKNLQVEMLYQRYFLRMNQNNTTHIVSLLLALVLLLASIHLIFALILASSTSVDTFSSTLENGAGSAAAVVMWDNGTTSSATTTGVSSVDNSNFTILSDNMTTTLWDAAAAAPVATQNETMLAATPNKTSNYFTPNILALVVTLGICGTICICK